MSVPSIRIGKTEAEEGSLTETVGGDVVLPALADHPLGTVSVSVEEDDGTQGQMLGVEKLEVSRWVPLKGMGPLLSEVMVGDGAEVATEAEAPSFPPTLPPTAWIDCQLPD